MFYRPHLRIPAPSGGELMTKQSHQAECDINNILKQYHRTGIITHINKNQPSYQDLPDPIDYQESLSILQTASNAFASLPAKVRDHFGNDPARFLRAFSDKSEETYLRDVGLLRPLPPPSQTSQEPSTAPSTP